MEILSLSAVAERKLLRHIIDLQNGAVFLDLKALAFDHTPLDSDGERFAFRDRLVIDNRKLSAPDN